MNKLKPLSPTLRERKRYMIYEVLSEKPIAIARKVSDAIEVSLQSLVGSIGSAKAGLIFLNDKYDAKTQRGVVRVTHTSIDPLAASLTFIQEIDHQPVIVRTLGVSGMLNKAISRFHTEAFKI